MCIFFTEGHLAIPGEVLCKGGADISFFFSCLTRQRKHFPLLLLNSNTLKKFLSEALLMDRKALTL